MLYSVVILISWNVCQIKYTRRLNIKQCLFLLHRKRDMYFAILILFQCSFAQFLWNLDDDLKFPDLIGFPWTEVEWLKSNTINGNFGSERRSRSANPRPFVCPSVRSVQVFPEISIFTFQGQRAIKALRKWSSESNQSIKIIIRELEPISIYILRLLCVIQAISQLSSPSPKSITSRPNPKAVKNPKSIWDWVWH